MTDVAKLCVIGADEFEDDPVGLVDPEAPDLMMLGMQFLGVKRGMKRIAFEQVRFCDGFPLDGRR